ncbi:MULTISPECIES: MarR family winged helix-turn-helix transcriptional regulator [Paenibacillus]|uniref:MarR family winged helix-turn-helix transcriptional regulator n=1 Tax=Paenibacillus TaxID=44249 RepID=UPI002FE043F4
MGDEPGAQRLMEAIARFRRADWHKKVLEGYKPSELRVLSMIEKGGLEDARGVTISAISEMMRVSAPTVTPLVRSLESMGLVVRLHDEEDRRVVRVRLTEKGERIREESREVYTRHFKELHDYLGETRSDQLADLLELVYRFLEQKHERDRRTEQNEI